MISGAINQSGLNFMQIESLYNIEFLHGNFSLGFIAITTQKPYLGLKTMQQPIRIWTVELLRLD